MTYKIFTAAFDQTVHASELLEEYERESLSNMRVATGTEGDYYWLDHDREAFRSALSQLGGFDQISSGKTIILLDNSGSMRGRRILETLLAVAAAGDAMDKAGHEFEILGFTTKSWKGGEARKEWLAERPREPGRLCEVRHIIYKGMDEPWDASALNLMFKTGLMKENIDGEALEWAVERARESGCQNIIMVSDAAPIDDSTLSVNASNFLSNHLAEVVKTIEATGDIHLSQVMICKRKTPFTKVFQADDQNVGSICKAIADSVQNVLERSAEKAPAAPDP